MDRQATGSGEFVFQMSTASFQSSSCRFHTTTYFPASLVPASFVVSLRDRTELCRLTEFVSTAP
jgi:hypothetical protein